MSLKYFCELLLILLTEPRNYFLQLLGCLNAVCAAYGRLQLGTTDVVDVVENEVEDGEDVVEGGGTTVTEVFDR